MIREGYGGSGEKSLSKAIIGLDDGLRITDDIQLAATQTLTEIFLSGVLEPSTNCRFALIGCVAKTTFRWPFSHIIQDKQGIGKELICY